MTRERKINLALMVSTSITGAVLVLITGSRWDVVAVTVLLSLSAVTQGIASVHVDLSESK